MRSLYTVNKFYGWISNNKYIGIPWWVANARNVDISSPRWAILSRSNSLSTTWTEIFTAAQWKPVAMIYGNSATSQLYAAETWYLSEYDWTIYNITAKITDVRNMWEIVYETNSYWFILWENKILQWQLNKWATDLWVWASAVNVVDSWVSLPNDLWGWTSSFQENCPYIIRNWILYVVAGKTYWQNIFTIDVSTTTWSALTIELNLDRWYNVTYMSQIWDQIIIYANNWKHWRQYFWDWTSSTAWRVIDWYDKPILWWVTLNNIDYLVVWTDKKRWFYFANWYQPQKIFETDVNVANEEAENFFFKLFWNNVMETIWDTIILPWVNSIYKYGNETAWLPKWITRDYVPWDIYLMSYEDSISNRLIVFYKDSDWDYRRIRQLIQSPDDSTWIYPLETNWIIETLSFDNWLYWQEKDAVKIRIWYELAPENENGINVYTKTNNRFKYANFYISTHTSTVPTVWSVYQVDSINYTVYDVTEKELLNWTDVLKWMILHCTASDETYSLVENNRLSSTLTKQSWDWDATLVYHWADEWYELVKKIWYSDTTMRKWSETFLCSTNMDDTRFNSIQLKFDLFSTLETITPKIYDSSLLFDIIENEL